MICKSRIICAQIHTVRTNVGKSQKLKVDIRTPQPVQQGGTQRRSGQQKILTFIEEL